MMQTGINSLNNKNNNSIIHTPLKKQQLITVPTDSRMPSPTNVITAADNNITGITIKTIITSSSSSSSNNMKELIHNLEQRYNDVIQKRDTLRKDLDIKEKELTKLLSDGNVKKPTTRESVTDLEMQMKKLEIQRETNSMPLAQEREILKQIYKLNKVKEQVIEYTNYDTTIKVMKETMKQLRQSISEITSQMNEIRIELDTAKTAQELGCDITELVGTTVLCPNDKIGRVIGKNGKTMKNIQDSSKVDLNIARLTRKSSKDSVDIDGINPMNSTDTSDTNNSKTIHLIGTYNSLNIAKTNIDNVLAKTEYKMDVTTKLMTYIMTKNIIYLPNLRQKYSNEETYDTYCTLHNMPTQTKESNIEPKKNTKNVATTTTSTQPYITIRGITKNIDEMKNEFMKLSDSIVEKSIIDIKSNDTGSIVGKNGSIIEKLVTDYQVAINLERHDKDDDKKDDEKKAIITLIGTSENVDNVMKVIRDIIHSNSESVQVVKTSLYVKSALLTKNGIGIQALSKRVNEHQQKEEVEVETTTSSTTALLSTSSYINISFVNDGIAVKCKNSLMKQATLIVQNEIQRIESITVTLSIDPMIIPVIIGKGGENMKQLREMNNNTVSIELDRTTNNIVVCGLNQDDINQVKVAIKDIIAKNHVEHVIIDNGIITNHVKTKCRDLLRTKGQEIRTLVFIICDDDKGEVMIRGEHDKVQQAKNIIHEFLEKNYVEELDVTKEDITALLNGGKNSKIVEIAKNNNVSLHSERDHNVIVGKGNKDHVQTSLRHIREFLYGSDNVIVLHIQLPNDDMPGYIIGKGGKTKKELEIKFNTISIIMNNNNNIITLRGPKDDVQECQMEILKLILKARVSQTYTMPIKTSSTKSTNDKKTVSTKNGSSSSSSQGSINQSKLKQIILRTVPIQIQFNNDNDKEVTFRGTYDNVQIAMLLTKEFVEGIYESHYTPGTLNNACVIFKRINESCKGDTSYIAKIEKETKCSIILNEKTNEIIISSGIHDHVKNAKIQLIKYFEFLLGDGQFKNVPIPTSNLLNEIAKSSIAIDTMIESCGAKVIVDRDTCSILIFDTDSNKVLNAYNMLKSKLDDEKNTIFTMKFDNNDEWIMPLLIGKKGVTINKLRKEANGCTIEVSSQDMKITITANDEDTFKAGKNIIMDYVAKLRSQFVYLTLTTKEMAAAFIGKNGSHIKDFSEKWKGVDIQITKSDKDANVSIVRVTATDTTKVNGVKLAIEEWIHIHKQEKERSAASSSEKKTSETSSSQHTLRLKADDIPIIIGSKGNVIRSIEKQFQCKMDIDKKTSILSIRRGSSIDTEKIQELFDTIRKIINGEIDTKTLIGNDENNNKNDTNIKKSPTKERNSEVINKTTSAIVANEMIEDNATEFPSLLASNSLVSNISNDDPTPVSTPKGMKRIGSGPSWATVISGTSSIQSSIDYQDDDHNDSSNNISENDEITEILGNNDNAISTATTTHEEFSSSKLLSTGIQETAVDIVSILETSTIAFLGDVADDSDDQ